MVKHPSLLSIPFVSSQKMMPTTDDNATMNVNIEGQDATLLSVSILAANMDVEFYLADKGKRI
jgi:hypothetical protein